MHPHISQWQNEMIEVAFAVSEPYGKYLGSSLKGTAPEEHEYITKQELSSSIEFGLSHQVPPKKVRIHRGSRQKHSARKG